MKKYELTTETIQFAGRTLHRIKALRDFGSVKAGKFGGWIENEKNLSQDDNAWIYGEAMALITQKYLVMQMYLAMQEFMTMQEFMIKRMYITMHLSKIM